MPTILGMGHCLPERRVDNQDLAKDLGIAADEIERRSGVRRRFYAADGEGPGALVCLAAFAAGFTWASALVRW